jgi:HEAT repeat protein
MRHLFRNILVSIIGLTLASTLSAEDVPDASPAGSFEGAIELPLIARFRELPQRVHLEPSLDIPPVEPFLDQKFLPFFIRMLTESEETEIQQIAAESLATLAREDLCSIKPALDRLHHHFKNTADRRVRYACAMAIVAADDPGSAPVLIECLSSGDEGMRQLVEPVLARWQIPEVAAIWTERLTDRSATTSGFRMAADGLARLGEQSVLSLLSDFVVDTTLPFSRRIAAAEAALLLDSNRSRELAETLISGTLHDRLICIRLLASDDPESSKRLLTLCSDTSGTVATAAWNTVLEHEAKLLIPLLESGRQHAESGIRLAAAETMKRFPDQQRSVWLGEMTGDIHIQVRNIARSCLRHVAQSDTGLHELIVQRATDMLSAESDQWQTIEQSLLLLGELRQSGLSTLCIPLLEHDRGEVAVTSAWLLHLFPDAKVLGPVVQFAKDREAWLNSVDRPLIELPPQDVGLQVGYLFQVVGLLRDRQLGDVLRAQFSKSTSGGEIKRSAAMWALGLLHEGESDSPLIAQFESRATDTMGLNPESDMVRQASVISIGRLRSKTSNSVLMSLFRSDSLETRIPQSVHWVMRLLDESVPDLPPPPVKSIGGFPLAPVTNTN